MTKPIDWNKPLECDFGKCHPLFLTKGQKTIKVSYDDIAYPVSIDTGDPVSGKLPHEFVVRNVETIREKAIDLIHESYSDEDHTSDPHIIMLNRYIKSGLLKEE